MTTPRLPTDQRREQLAEAALAILSSKGAGALTVKAIAQAVGISDGAVFRHYKDKPAIFDAAVARFESALTALPPEDLPPVERLGRFFTERVASVQARPEILGLLFSDQLQQVAGDKAARRIRKTMKESVTFLRACIQQAQEEGALDDTLRPDIVGWMVTGAMRGAAKTKTDPEEAWTQLRRALFTKAGRVRKR